MAGASSSKALLRKLFIFLSCTAIFIQTGLANASNPPPVSDLVQQKAQGCARSFAEAGACLVDLWTKFGRPSEACCKALKSIDETCWPALLPLLNPTFAPFLRGLCPLGGIRGGLRFPHLPLPFPSPPSGSAGGLPFPFPFPFPSLNPPPPAEGSVPPSKA